MVKVESGKQDRSLGSLVVKCAGDLLIVFSAMGDVMAKGIPLGTGSGSSVLS